MSAATGVLWAAGPLRSRANAADESVQTTIGWEAAWSITLNSSSSAAFKAKSSAQVLEQRDPAATRTSRVSSSENTILAPPLPSRTPPEAEPSDHTHVASAGRAASRSSAAFRLVSEGRSRRPSGPTSRAKETPVTSCHGGSVTWSRSSIFTGSWVRQIRVRASRPWSLQPVVVFRRRVGAASASALRGSPSGSEDARPSIRADRTSRRTRAVGIPASAIRAWTGVETGHPVTTLAAARSSRSTRSRCDGDDAGIQAPAAYSRAPRT